jgi:hypothetical protein
MYNIFNKGFFVKLIVSLVVGRPTNMVRAEIRDFFIYERMMFYGSCNFG